MNILKFSIVFVVLASVLGGLYIQKQRGNKLVPPNAIVTTIESKGIKYLPLGDSYTIGESVAESERWPNQLVERLKAQDIELQIVANPSVTGYTSQDLIDEELPVLSDLQPEFVTVLIGVNDYVQGVPAATFQTNLRFILNAVQGQLTNPKALMLVTIPDYGKTPSGARFGNPAGTEKGIKEFNQIIVAEALARKIPVADIFSVSQQVAQDKSLVASDGLHPSGKQYTAWTDVIFSTLTSTDIFKSSNPTLR